MTINLLYYFFKFRTESVIDFGFLLLTFEYTDSILPETFEENKKVPVRSLHKREEKYSFEE